MTTPCVLRLLGAFELRYADVPYPVPRTTRRLLALVALHERPVRRLVVSGTLWPTASEERANASLRSALWRVPRCGGIAVLRSSATHVWLDDRVAVDLPAAVDTAYQVLDAPRNELLQEACSISDALAEGLLPDWNDDWVEPERQRYLHLRLQALDRLAELLLESGRVVEAMEVAQAGVRAQPLHESAHRLAIKSYLQQGRRQEAVRHFRSFARLYAQQGARPSTDMLTLLGLERTEPAEDASPICATGQAV